MASSDAAGIPKAHSWEPEVAKASPRGSRWLRGIATALILLGAAVQVLVCLLLYFVGHGFAGNPADTAPDPPGTHFELVVWRIYPLAASALLVSCALVPGRLSPTLAAAAAGMSCLGAIVWILLVVYFLAVLQGASQELNYWIASTVFLVLCTVSICAYGSAMRRAWQRARRNLQATLSIALFAIGLCLPAVIPGVPFRLAESKERLVIEAIGTGSDTDLAHAVSKLRPWTDWTRLDSILDLSRSDSESESARAAAAYEQLTGIDPRAPRRR